MRGRASVSVLAVTACAILTACTPAVNGAVGVTLDEQGRLAAVVATCLGAQLGWLTLENHSTGARATYAAQGGTPDGDVVTLTGPVGETTRQGVLDLFDLDDEYTLRGGTAKGDDRLLGVRFRLRDVIADPQLRQGYVLHGEQGKVVKTARDEFLRRKPSFCR